MASEVAGFREYVTGRMDQLRRTAYLLCSDWHTADDLVSTALVKLYRHWGRASTVDNLHAYTRQILVRAWLDECRRPWRRERAWETLPDRGAPVAFEVADRVALLAQLAELPPRQRAVIVLRYFCDLSIEDTAEVLGCTAGTVKSQTARALQTLRGRLVGIAYSEK